MVNCCIIWTLIFITSSRFNAPFFYCILFLCVFGSLRYLCCCSNFISLLSHCFLIKQRLVFIFMTRLKITILWNNNQHTESELGKSASSREMSKNANFPPIVEARQDKKKLWESLWLSGINDSVFFFGFFDIMHNILRFQIHRYSVCPGRESWLTHPDFLLIFLPLYYMHMHGVTVSILAEVNEAFFIWSHNFSFFFHVNRSTTSREKERWTNFRFFLLCSKKICKKVASRVWEMCPNFFSDVRERGEVENLL